MLQTLSWLKNYQEPLKHILTIKPKWIAISSLFYEGEIDAFITLHNYYRPSNKCDYSMSYYNIYSLPRIKDFLKSHGYNKFKYKKFEIDINIKQTTKDIGTYTKMTIDKKNLQFSGPLFLPWYFIYAEK